MVQPQGKTNTKCFPPSYSFDNLVGVGENDRRDSEAELLRGLELPGIVQSIPLSVNLQMPS